MIINELITAPRIHFRVDQADAHTHPTWSFSGPWAHKHTVLTGEHLVDILVGMLVAILP